jgi:Protein of unknown function (DUF3054)
VPARRMVVLAIGDALVLLLFAVIGLLSHHRGVGGHGLARDALPVLAGWFTAATLFGTYHRDTRRAFLGAWAVGVTGGVLVRGVVLHRHVFSGKELTFLAVTLGVTLALLLAWRALFALARRRGQERSATA